MLKSLFGHLPHSKKKKASTLAPLNVNGFNNDEFQEAVNRMNPIFVDNDDPNFSSRPETPIADQSLNELNSIEEYVQDSRLSSWLHKRDDTSTLDTLETFETTEREALRVLDQAISETDHPFSLGTNDEVDTNKASNNASSYISESAYEELSQISERIPKPGVKASKNISERNGSDSDNLATQIPNGQLKKEPLTTLEDSENQLLHSNKQFSGEETHKNEVEEVTVQKTMNIRAKAIEELIKKFQIPKPPPMTSEDSNNSSKELKNDVREINKEVGVDSSIKRKKRNKKSLRTEKTLNSDKYKKNLENEIARNGFQPTQVETQDTKICSSLVEDTTEKSDQVPEKNIHQASVVKQDQATDESITVANQTSHSYDTSNLPKGLFAKNDFHEKLDSAKLETEQATGCSLYNDQKQNTLDKNIEEIEKKSEIVNLLEKVRTSPQSGASSGNSLRAKEEETTNEPPLDKTFSNNVLLSGILSNKKENHTKNKAVNDLPMEKGKKGVTRGDQSDSTPEEVHKFDMSANKPKTNKRKFQAEKVTNHTRSCHHRIKSLEDNLSNANHYEDYYDIVARDNRYPRWHRKRPESWASDMTWDELAEREYLSRHYYPGLRFFPESGFHHFPGRLRRSQIYRDPLLWPQLYPQNGPRPVPNFKRRNSITSATLNDDYDSFRYCPCEECQFLRKDLVRRNSFRCTCDHNSVYADKKVTFADKIEGIAKTELPLTEEVPETETESLSELTTPHKPASTSQNDKTEKPKESEEHKEHAKNGPIKPLFLDGGKSTLLQPWELEQWNFVAKQKLLRRRRRRALFMGGMALVLVVFVGLSVGMVMVYLRRKSL